MFILFWLVLVILAWAVGLAVFRAARSDFARYSGMSFFGATILFIVVILGSLALELMRIGVPYSLSVPQDYVARGIPGLLLLLLALVSICLPLVVAWLESRGGTPSPAPR